MSDATITLSPTENVIKSDTQVDGHDPSMLISMRDIWKTYQMGTEKVHALHGVSFDIPRGELGRILLRQEHLIELGGEESRSRARHNGLRGKDVDVQNITAKRLLRLRAASLTA